MLRSLSLSLLLMSIIVPTTSRADYYYGEGSYGDVSYGLHYDDNVSRAQNQADIENDFISKLAVRYGDQAIINHRSLFSFYGDLAYHHSHDFNKLSNLEIAATGNYIYQVDTGFFSPWIETSVRISRKQFQDSDIRDSYFLLTSAKIGKRVFDNVSASAGYQYEQRFSRRKVFDLSNHNLLADLEYTLTDNSLLYTTYKISVGDKVSTATPNARIIAAANQVAPDDVFSPGLGPGCMNRRCAYQLDGISQQVSTGINFNILDRFDIDLSGSYHYTDADGDNRYRGFVYGAGLWLVF